MLPFGIYSIRLFSSMTFSFWISCCTAASTVFFQEHAQHDHTYQKHLIIYLFRHLNHCSHCRLDKLNATQEEWKLRATGTTIGCHTIGFLRLDTTLSCDNKSIVYAPISRLRRSFAGIRKMPTSKAIKKRLASKLAVSFFIALIGALFIAFAYITRWL